MATTASIVVALRANSSAFRKGMQDGKAALKEFRDDAKRTAEYARSLDDESKGLLGSFKALKTAAAAISLELVGRALVGITAAMKDFQAATRDGTKNWADFTAGLLEALPIVGGFATAGRNIGEMFLPEEETAAYAQEQMRLADERHKAAMKQIDEERKAREKARDDAAAKQAAGQAPVEDLRNQLVGLMGEDTALQFKLNQAGASDAQRAEAMALYEDIKAWKERNAAVEKAAKLNEDAIDAGKRAIMTERDYTIAKLEAAGATKEQIELARQRLDLEDVNAQIKDIMENKGSPAVSSGDTVAALTKGSVAAAQAERRNETNAKAMLNYQKAQADNLAKLFPLVEKAADLTGQISMALARLEAA